MRTNKCTQFVNDLNYVLNIYNRNYVKSFIGDSTNNNRTLTVNQVVRFLNATGRYTLAATLTAVSKRLTDDINASRYYSDINRTDAVDINEFLNVYGEVITDTTTVRSLSQVISRAV